MSRKFKPRVDLKDPKNKMLLKLVEHMREEVTRRYGTELTYEERRDASATVISETLWADEDKELQEPSDRRRQGGDRRHAVPSAEASVVGSVLRAVGRHEVEEPLYGVVGVHNGVTIKPIERRVGMIARRMTPDLARIVGELSADANSREIGRTMETVGMVPPSRSFLREASATRLRLPARFSVRDRMRCMLACAGMALLACGF